MKSSDLYCWKCAASLADVLIPFSRLAKCKGCNTDLHVCMMCKFYDTTVSNSCTEPVAEKVTNKKLKNFCGFFQPNPAVRPPMKQAGDSSRSQLEALFGISNASKESVESPEELARRKLQELFGNDNEVK